MSLDNVTEFSSLYMQSEGPLIELDSIENQEGGAMYISCGDDGAGGVESEMGYVPNNPLFGLPLDSPQECTPSCSGCASCQTVSSLPIPGLHGSDFDCDNCLDHNGILSSAQLNSQSNLGAGFWGPEDMNSFSGLSPLDKDPLPSLFPFSPCGASYKSERPTHDMADVLLSLKHAVLKPSPDPQQMQSQTQAYSHSHHPQSSLSYTVHPQMLVSPSHQSQVQNSNYSSSSYYDTPCGQHPPSIYPSMSVNVSMNMTMHGYGAEASVPMQCSQMQWTPQNPSSSVNVLYSPLLSPGHYLSGATYSFTADFRPPGPTQAMGTMIDNMKISSGSPPRNYYQSNVNYSPPISPNYGQMKIRPGAKSIGFDEEEDSNDGVQSDSKPNLCRLCGKTYARPSSAQLNSQSNLGAGFWGPEDMNSFSGLSPLDKDPLPSLFPFSPCGASYKSERPTHDMADVLLSLKHAVLKPSPDPQQMQSQTQAYSHSHHPQASLSYTVHPQMLVSPSHQSQVQNSNYSSSSYYDTPCGQHPPSIYPSMSVNVSMNMTMHGYGAEASVPMQCSQMQWTPQNPSSSVNVLYSPLLSPGHYLSGATYSFTADFRPPGPTQAMGTMIDNMKISSGSPPRNYYQSNVNYSPPISPNYGQMKIRPGAKSIGFDEEEDSNDGVQSDSKPNLCRLCGKTYARPSTLKTHLRTHSGERPYRCPDCNKSFSQAANLTAHVRTHTGQKPFRCPICDRRFSQSSSVTTHLRTHSGERPYRCRSCKKAFSDSSTLTKHLRIHSGEKPYQCKLCLLRFSQSGNLNRHMRVHGSNGNLMT